jgi:hypothetical protein
MNNRSGQSLIEILVAVAVGTLIIMGAVSILSPTLQAGNSASQVQAASALGKELLEGIRSAAASNWNGIYALSKNTGVAYYLNSTSSQFSFVTGTQVIVSASTSVSRNFTLSNVNRDSGGGVVTSGGFLDPSTLLVTVAYSWPRGGASKTLQALIVRPSAGSWSQTDWSGGATAGGFSVSGTDNRYVSGDNIDVSTTTGSIRINGI